MSIPWDDEALALLRRRLEEGATYSVIAGDLTRLTGRPATRSVVAGLVMRMGLGYLRPVRSEVIAARPARPPRPRDDPPPVVDPPPPPLSDPRPPGLPIDDRDGLVGIMGLRRGVCHWPMWGVRERSGMYCGCPSRWGSVYCAEHHARAYAPVRPSRSALRRRWRP